MTQEAHCINGRMRVILVWKTIFHISCNVLGSTANSTSCEEMFWMMDEIDMIS